MTHHAENPTHKPRHCERSEAIHRAASREQRPLRLVATSLHGLPRFARNDWGYGGWSSRPRQSHPYVRHCEERSGVDDGLQGHPAINWNGADAR